jgi:hypothetical protein
LPKGQMAVTSRLAVGAMAVISAVMGEGRNPLKVSHSPRENSHWAIGRVAIAVQGEIGSMMPNRTAMVEAIRRGAPMNPVRGSTRFCPPECRAADQTDPGPGPGRRPGIELESRPLYTHLANRATCSTA